jgi:hypothetical protein
LDCLSGEGTCDLAIQNWPEMTDKIIEEAKKSANTSIEKKNRKLYAQEDMKNFCE